MRLGKYIAAVAAVSMAAAPALAAPANPAASLSVSKSVRASAPSAKQNKIGSSGYVIAAIAIAAIAGGIIAATSGSKSK
ncbi:MAG: hypothetical protein V4459_09230 [Pseudomonadota bacterium]